MLQWQRNLRMIFAQWIYLFYQAQKYTWKINYTLGGREIHGKQIEQLCTPLHW